MGSQNDILVSVVIPCYNRRDDLRRCLQGLILQKQNTSHIPAFEVIVVDNGSEDGTADMLHTEFSSVRLLRNSVNLGASKARNQALKIILNKYVWFLDSDSVVENLDSLVWMVKIMEENYDIGSIGGELIKDTQGKVILKSKRILLNGETGAKSIEPHKAKLVNCDYLATCNCFTRRELLLKIGGFDPDYFVFSEDKELGLKIKKLGYRNVCDYRTAVFHNITFSQRRSIFLKYRNVIRFALKNLSICQILIMPFSTVLIKIKVGEDVYRQLKKDEPAVLKYVPKHLSFFGKLFFLGGMYILALLWAYMWNLWHLFPTLKARFKRRNYIEYDP
ncbi:glycosyltransferase family 2 protein [Candidatus Omnitrophota bacterium]